MFSALRPASRTLATRVSSPSSSLMLLLMLVLTRLPSQAFSSTAAASDVSRLTLVGRLGSEPTIRQTKNGKDFLVYKVVTNDPYRPPAEGRELSLPFLALSSLPTLALVSPNRDSLRAPTIRSAVDHYPWRMTARW